MYRKCIIPGCNSTLKNAKLHKFPKCVKRLRKWLDCINSNFLLTIQPCELLRFQVCHLHFETRFVTAKLRLSSSAYPSLFLHSEILSGVPRKNFYDETPPPDHNAYTKAKHNDHNYYQEKDITRTLQPTSAEKHPLFVNPVLQQCSTPSVLYKVTGTSIVENIKPTVKAKPTQPPEIAAKSDVSGTQYQTSAQEENSPTDENSSTESATHVNTAENRILYVNPVLQPCPRQSEDKPSTELATSVNTAENSIIYVKHILRPCPKPSFLNKVTGTANIKNTNRIVTAKSATQLIKLVPKSVATGTIHQSSAQGVFSSFLSEDRKKRRARMKNEWAQRKREKAQRKEIMIYKRKEACFKSLPQDVQTFINIQMNKANKGNGRRYKAEEMALAQKIFTECRQTYRYMSKIFLLPSKTSLVRYAKRKRLSNTV